MEIREDDWLSARLGRPVFTLTGFESGADPDAIRGHANVHPAATYQLRLPTGRVDLVHLAGQAGLRVVSTGVTLTRLAPAAPANGPADRSPEPVEVRDLDERSDTGVLAIAETCFRTSRFHLDPAIPIGVANGVKREWVSSYFRGERGEGLLVASRAREPVGFLGVLSGGSDGERVRSIDLIGVARGEQRRGAGSALVERFLEQSRDRCDRVEVGTQTANEPAIRFYERLGFVVARTYYDLHLHVGDAAT